MLLGQGVLWLVSTLTHIFLVEPLEKTVAAREAVNSMHLES